MDILKVNLRFFLNIFPGVYCSRAAVEFLQLVLCKAIKTVRTMNLKFVWSELHLISVRSQNLLAFATCSRSVRKYSPCIVQCQQPFHIFSIRCQSIEKLHRKYRSCKAKRTGSASPHGLPFEQLLMLFE